VVTVDIDATTLVFLCAAIFVGFYLRFVWFSVIFIIVLALFLWAGKGERGTMVPVPEGPMVRPIIVKRRYVGPESIYPSYMKIRVSKPGFWSGDPWWENAGKGIGKFLGPLFRRVRGERPPY
jgi:energy-coupling factor transporter transmembrane protein EcfT